MRGLRESPCRTPRPTLTNYNIAFSYYNIVLFILYYSVGIVKSHFRLCINLCSIKFISHYKIRVSYYFAFPRTIALNHHRRICAISSHMTFKHRLPQDTVGQCYFSSTTAYTICRLHTAKLNMPRKKAVKKSRRRICEEVVRRDDNIKVFAT